MRQQTVFVSKVLFDTDTVIHLHIYCQYLLLPYNERTE